MIDDESDHTEEDSGTSDQAVSHGEERVSGALARHPPFSDEVVFGELGVLRLRAVQLNPRS